MSTLITTNLKNPSSGSNNLVLAVDGTVGINSTSPQTQLDVVGGIKGVITSGTAVASTSGTSIDFTSIPSWVKRITVMLDEVSLSGTDLPLLQLGTSSGVSTTNYVSTASFTAAASYGTITSVIGFPLYGGNATHLYTGTYVCTKINDNTWIVVMSAKGATYTCTTAGRIALAATLDRVRIATRLAASDAAGSNTFDAGTINILYEG